MAIQSNNWGRVAVLCGGDSCERDISLLSGREVYNALQNLQIDAVFIDVQPNTLIQELDKVQPHYVLNMLHGPGGEGGQVQAVLEYLQLPYWGSDVAASALSLDKMRTKWIWDYHGLSTPKAYLIHSLNEAEQKAQKMTFPIAVKPVHDGSSIGISKITTMAELPKAFDKAYEIETDVMLEEWKEGYELTVGIVGETLLPSVHIAPQRPYYDYQAKYLEDTTQYYKGDYLIADTVIHPLARQAFDILGCHGWGRVDFLLDHDQQLWLIEMNTIPGMTQKSLLPKEAKYIEWSYEDLLLAIMQTKPQFKS